MLILYFLLYFQIYFLQNGDYAIRSVAALQKWIILNFSKRSAIRSTVYNLKLLYGKLSDTST